MVETKKDSSGEVAKTTVTAADGSSVKTENKPDGSILVTITDEDDAVTEITVIAADDSKTVTVYNEDGTTTVIKYDPDGKVVKDTDNSTAPYTGDNSNMILWIDILFISGGTLTTLGITGKRRKE